MSKYHAIKTVVDGITFASRAEARRYEELAWAEKSGDIQTLGVQPRFKLTVNGSVICTYVGDFDYWENGVYIVEDVKGMLTPVYRLKRKLMKAIHNIDIRETE